MSKFPPKLGASVADAQILHVPLDHFNMSDPRTLPLRYWIDSSVAKEGGPIFIHMGGEAAAGPVRAGPREEAHGAVAVGYEHRFYGESVPEGELERDNMPYLSVEQNLADAKAVVEHVRGSGTNAAVAFGGSYSGATCAWFRVQYPETVAGCVSESGVVNAILNFTEFDTVIAQATSHPDTECSGRLHAAFAAVDRAFFAGHNDTIKKQFNASNLVGTPNGDTDFMYAIADATAMLDQYGSKAELCAGLQEIAPDASDDERISNLGDIINKAYGSTFVSGCFYDSVCVRDRTKSGSGVGERQWRWQKCSQLAYLQAAPRNDLRVRSELLTLDVLLAQCDFMFGVTPDTSIINAKFGGANPKGTNIFFINYSDDPWKAASVEHSEGASLPFCMTTCDGCGHCGAGVPANLTKCEDSASDYVSLWLK